MCSHTMLYHSSRTRVVRTHLTENFFAVNVLFWIESTCSAHFNAFYILFVTRLANHFYCVDVRQKYFSKYQRIEEHLDIEQVIWGASFGKRKGTFCWIFILALLPALFATFVVFFVTLSAYSVLNMTFFRSFAHFFPIFLHVLSFYQFGTGLHSFLATNIFAMSPNGWMLLQLTWD